MKLFTNFIFVSKIPYFFKKIFFIVNIINILINIKKVTKVTKIPVRYSLLMGKANLSPRSTNEESKYKSKDNVIKINKYFWESRLTKWVTLVSINLILNKLITNHFIDIIVWIH